MNIISICGGNIRIVIFFFGEGRGKCKGYEVKWENIKFKFFFVNDGKKENLLLLDNFVEEIFCVFINIYDFFKEVICLFGDKEDIDFYIF